MLFPPAKPPGTQPAEPPQWANLPQVVRDDLIQTLTTMLAHSLLDKEEKNE